MAVSTNVEAMKKFSEAFTFVEIHIVLLANFVENIAGKRG